MRLYHNTEIVTLWCVLYLWCSWEHQRHTNVRVSPKTGQEVGKRIATLFRSWGTLFDCWRLSPLQLERFQEEKHSARKASAATSPAYGSPQLKDGQDPYLDAIANGSLLVMHSIYTYLHKTCFNMNTFSVRASATARVKRKTGAALLR